MAFKITKRLYDHLNVSYCRISHVALNGNLQGKVRMDFYSDQEERSKLHESGMFKWYPVQWEGTLNYVGDAYTFLKSHPDFEGAEDI